MGADLVSVTGFTGTHFDGEWPSPPRFFLQRFYSKGLIVLFGAMI
jgi:hypothetical protein